MWQNWNGGTIKLGTTKGLFHVYSVVVYAFVLQEHVRLLLGFLSFTQFTVIYSRGIQFLNFHCRWLWCLKVFPVLFCGTDQNATVRTLLPWGVYLHLNSVLPIDYHLYSTVKKLSSDCDTLKIVTVLWNHLSEEVFSVPTEFLVPHSFPFLSCKDCDKLCKRGISAP